METPVPCVKSHQEFWVLRDPLWSSHTGLSLSPYHLQLISLLGVLLKLLCVLLALHLRLQQCHWSPAHVMASSLPAVQTLPTSVLSYLIPPASPT